MTLTVLTRTGLGKPATTDLINVTTALNDNLDIINGLMTMGSVGLFSARPAAGTANRLYFATDVDGGTLYVDNGTAWVIPASRAEQRFEPGDFKWSGRANPSAGWLKCDFSAVSRTTYADLFAAIGTTYGVGDGSTTFNLPDSQGRTLVGAGAGSGLTARTLGAKIGAETVALTAAQAPLRNHTHSMSGAAPAGHAHSYSGTTGNNNAGGVTVTSTGAGTNWGSLSYNPHGHAYSGVTDAAGAAGNTGTPSVAETTGSAHENMQPSLVGNLFIKT